MKDSQRKAMFAKKRKGVSAEDIANKLNSNLTNDYVPRDSRHINDVETLSNGNVKFRYSGGTIDPEIKKMFKKSGFKISNVHNILDAGHLDAEGKL
jgi:hypothetical protein